MIDLNGKLRLHERCRFNTAYVGNDRLPVVIVDDFLRDPDILIEYAASRCAFEGVSDTFYPGMRAPAPPIYCFALRAFLGDAIATAFGLPSGGVNRELSHFSLITTLPERLSIPQRMPHFDSPDPRQLAVLHYLCDAEHGGTSFYRHRQTGFEFVDAARSPPYLSAVKQELASGGFPAARYICGDDAIFERTASFSAAFNRVLIYRSIDLHSADVLPGYRFDGNPRSGRLTANTFFFYR
jgi:Family of unknown function (DUF6445)